MATLSYGAHLEARKVRARAGFGIALTPPIRSIQNAGQPVLLLGSRSKLDEPRAQHRPAHGNDSRRRGERDFLRTEGRLDGKSCGSKLTTRGQPSHSKKK